MSVILSAILRFVLSKEIIKRIAQPLIDEMFDYLDRLAKDSESDIDDKAVAIFREAVKQFLKVW